MSDGDKPATQDDVVMSVVILIIFMMLLSFMDSCVTRFRYLDLRDRLERVEQSRR